MRNKSNIDYKVIGAIASVVVAVTLIIGMVASPGLKAPDFKRNWIGSDYLYAAENKIFNVEVGVKKANKPYVEFSTTKDSRVKFTLLDSNETVKKPVKDGNKLTFEEVMDGVDLSYETLENGIKEEIILKQKPSSNEFIFGMELESADAQEIVTNFPNPVFYDKEGNYLFHFTEPFAFDATGNTTYDVIMQVRKSPIEGNYQIRLTVDEQWLYSSDRVYPIVIDPTVVHDTDGEFSGGSLNRIEATSNQIKSELNATESKIDSNTVLIHRMDETADNTCNGGEDVCDKSGNGLDGTFTGSTAFADINPIGTGGSVEFDGIDDYYTVADNANLDSFTSLTIEAWIYPDETDFTSGGIVRKDGSYLFKFNNDTMLCRLYLDSAWSTGTVSTSSVVKGQWNHVACTWDGSEIKYYINGKLDDTVIAASGTMADNGNEMRVGINWSSEYFDGYLDELRISNTARSSEEIKENAKRNSYGVYTSPVINLGGNVKEWVALSWEETGVDGEDVYDNTNLVAQWNLNETSGTTADNATGNSTLDGTLTNFNDTSQQDANAVSTWTAGSRWGEGALIFDGVDDYILVDDDGSLDFTSTFTASFWVNYGDTAGVDDPIIHNQYIITPFNGYSIKVSDADDIIELWTDGEGAFTDIFNTPLQKDKWHHIAISFSGNTVSAYLDGKLDKTTTGISNATANGFNFLIGGDTRSGDYFTGKMDAIQMYGRALGKEEIKVLYSSSDVKFQTRTGPDTSTNDGDWSSWSPTLSETQILSLDSDASNWFVNNLGTQPESNIIISNASFPNFEGSGSLKFELGHAPIDSNVVAEYHLDGTNGDNANVDAFDATSNNLDGEFNGTNLASAVVDGIKGKARSFNGTDDYISTSINSQVDDLFADAGSNWTVEAWFKTTNATQSNMIVGKGGGTGTGATFGVYTDSSGNLITLIRGSYTTVASNVNDGRWHYVSVSWNGSNGTATFDGNAEVPLNIGTASLQAQNVIIGAQAGGTNTFFDGEIDEVRLSNIARTSEERLEAYRMGSMKYAHKSFSATDLSDDDMLSFYVAGDRPGTYLEATIGESDLANYQADSNTSAIWHLDEIKNDACNGSSDDVCDASPNANNGDINGSPSIVNGKVGKARSFNGSTDYITVQDDPALDIGNKLTLMGWFNVDDTAANRGIISKATEYLVRIESDDQLKFFLYDGVDYEPNLASSVVPTADKWHHFAAVYDSTLGSNHQKLYLDGVLVGQQDRSITTTPTTNSLFIGYFNSAYMDGELDEISVHTEALSAEEVRQAYERERRTMPITIDFAAALSSEDLISGSSDLEFIVDGTVRGLEKRASYLFSGEKIIVRETVDDTTYIAQGTIKTAEEESGKVILDSWDGSSTFPSSGYTANADVMKWQKEYFDFDDIYLDTDIGAVDEITLRITDGNEGRTVYLDDVSSASDSLLSEYSGSNINSATDVKYVQYKALFTDTINEMSATVSDVTLDYITRSPDAYWKFDENYGTTAYDHSTNALNGTLGASTTWASSDKCISKTCLEFKESDTDFVEIADNDFVDIGESMTIQGWFNVKDTAANRGIISKADEYIVRVESDDQLKFFLYDGTDYEPSLAATISPTPDNWHHFAAVYDSTLGSNHQKLYLDGVLVGQQDRSITTTPTTNNLIIGKFSSGYFKGFLDEIKIYRYARTAAEIKSDFSAVAAVKGASASFNPDNSYISEGLVGYYAMEDQAVGSTWYDQNYDKRMPVTLTYSGSTLTNHDVLISLDTASLISGGKMQSDCDDIRITDSNETTLINYWVESGCNTANTQIWARVPSIPDGGKTIYVYYDYASATNGEQAWSGNFITLYNSATCPTGWTRFTSMDSRFPVSFTTAGATGGASSHTHSNSSGSTTTGGGTTVRNLSGITVGNETHTHSITSTISSNSVLPPYYDIVLCQKSDLDINSGLIVMDDASVKSGFTRFTSLDGRMPRSSSTPGGTGGASTHSHTISSNVAAGGGSNSCVNWNTSPNKSVAGSNHDHSIPNKAAETVSNLPPYQDIIFASANSNTVAPIGSQVMATAIPPLGWTEDASMSNRVPRGALTPGGTGGASTHNHSQTIDGFGNPTSTSNCLNESPLQTVSNGGHTHTYTFTSSDTTNWPPYYKLPFIEKNNPSATTSNGSEETYTAPGYSLTDESGYDNTLTGQNDITSGVGKFGNGLVSDGAGDYADIVSFSNLPSSEITVAAWIKLTSNKNYNRVIAHGDWATANAGTWLLYGDSSGNLNFGVADGSSQNTATKSGLTTGTWYHVVGTYDGKETRVYINGEMGTNDELIGQSLDTSGSLTVSGTGTGSLDGVIDEARIYSKALSEKDVKSLYNWAPGPIGYWPLDENTGTTTTYDKSGNGYDGTLESITEDSWLPGKYGASLDLDGSADHVEIGNISSMNFTSTQPRTISAWVKTTSTSFGAILAKMDDGTPYNGYDLFINNGVINTHLINTWSTNAFRATAGSGLNDGKWHYITITYDGSETSGGFNIYADGIPQSVTVDTTSYTPGSDTTSSHPVTIGARQDNSGNVSSYFDGQVDEVKVYNYIRTSSQIVEDMNGGHPIGGSPVGSQVGYWGLDDNGGQTAYDKGTDSNNGTLGATTGASTDDPSWKNDNECKMNGCLDFDGGDYVQVTETTALNLDGPLSITFWFNRDVAVGSYDTLISNIKPTNAKQYAIDINNNKLRFGDETGVGVGSTTISDDTWYHVAAVYNDTANINGLSIYINGIKETLTELGTFDGMETGTGNLFFGQKGNSTEYFNGKIDEIKIYSTALTEDQVKVDMNAGSNATLGGVLGTSEKSYLGIGNTGPSSYWPMDENTGTITTYDKSGNKYDGALNSITESSWVRGVYGSALDFDGTADYVTLPNSDTLITNDNNWSMSLWFNADTIDSGDHTDRMVDFYKDGTGNSAIIISVGSSDNLELFHSDGVSGTTTVITEATINAGTWYHTVLTYDGTSYRIYLNGILIKTITDGFSGFGAYGATLGRYTPSPGNYYDGKIDEFKTFNHTLSTEEIVYEYSRGKPFGWWKFDECTGTTAYDSGSGGNNATITIGGSGTNSSAGTCSGSAGQSWYDGSTGKINSSLEFDGSDDYVACTDAACGGTTKLDISSNDNLSYSAWIKTSTTGAQQVIMSKKNVITDGGNGWMMYINGSNYAVCTVSDGTNAGSATSTTTVTDGNWHNITCTLDGSNILTYVDGKQEGSASISSVSGTIDSSVDFRIGNQGNDGNSYTGQIDDVRVYKYTLTGNKIKNLINDGSAVRFAD